MGIAWRTLGFIGAALLAGCAPEGDHASTTAKEPEAEVHDDQRLLVQYAANSYFVDIRYVDIINESVIAVRTGGGKTDGRREVQVPATVGVPSGEPFASNAYEPLVISIAEHLRKTEKICSDGQQMALRINREGEAKVTYRRSRAAWVVFAACPVAVTG
ncbi:MAG: hypothetical protein AAGE80_10770 [Pseudomonadota bacterium]